MDLEQEIKFSYNRNNFRLYGGDDEIIDKETNVETNEETNEETNDNTDNKEIDAESNDETDIETDIETNEESNVEIIDDNETNEKSNVETNDNESNKETNKDSNDKSRDDKSIIEIFKQHWIKIVCGIIALIVIVIIVIILNKNKKSETTGKPYAPNTLSNIKLDYSTENVDVNKNEINKTETIVKNNTDSEINNTTGGSIVVN